MVLEDRAKGGLYELPLNLNHSGAALTCFTQSHFLRHCRLGHLYFAYMSELLNKGLIKYSSKQSKLCDSCLTGKSQASPHLSHNTSYATLSLVFAVIWGPSPILLHQGYSYYVNFVDVASNFNWVFPMAHKSDVYKVFDDFHRWAIQ